MFSGNFSYFNLFFRPRIKPYFLEPVNFWYEYPEWFKKIFSWCPRTSEQRQDFWRFHCCLSRFENFDQFPRRILFRCSTKTEIEREQPTWCSDVFHFLASDVGHVAKQWEDGETGKNGRPAVNEGDQNGVSVTVVSEFIVGGHGKESAESNPERIENLSRCIAPNLANKWIDHLEDWVAYSV